MHLTPRLVTLGSACLSAPDQSGAYSTILRPGKPLALLVHLACSANRTASREHLLNLLWSDTEPERGLRTIRQTIFRLRRDLGEESLVADGRFLRLSLSFTFDRDEFLSAVTTGDTAAAAGLYTGPFLPDFGVPGGAEFEHWCDRERDRLQAAYIRSAESFIRDSLDRSHHAVAVAEARRLRDFDPEREASWRLLLESLSSSGDWLATVAEAEQLERLLAEDDREPESLTRSAITRAKRTSLAPQVTDSHADTIMADLTGRDREFARLTSAWSDARAGRFRHIHVSSPPGFGKTRLLRDVHTRLRAAGARPVWIGAIAADRRLPHALVSDIAGKLGVRAGASGISTAAAASLVSLNPTLSSSFAVDSDRSEGDEALRKRIHAFHELLEAVADESPLCLFVDDLHWGDPASRQVLKSALSRMTAARVMVVTSARLVPDSDLHLAATEELSLAPLTPEQTGDLVTGIGCLPEDDWAGDFLDALHEHSGGSPLLILENLRLAANRGLLSVDESGWTTTDADALVSAISRGDVLDQRIRKLEPELHRLMVALSVVGEPIEPGMLASVLARDTPDIDGQLAVLEQSAFVSRADKCFYPAHDSIADTVIRTASPEVVTALNADIGKAFASREPASLHSIRLAVTHLNAGGEHEPMQKVYALGVSLARASGDRRSHLALAAAMLGEGAPSETAAGLAASLPLVERLRLREPSRIAAAAAIALSVTAFVFVIAGGKPNRLAVISHPIAGNTLVVPPPVVEIQDRKGRRIVGATDSITVESIGGRPRISGSLTVAAVGGRATFNDVVVVDEGQVNLRFSAKGLESAEADPINITGLSSSLRLVSGVINGHRVNAKARTVNVSPGEQINAELMLEYTSRWPSASVILGATAVWGDRRTNFIGLDPLFTPAMRQPRRTRFQFTAPELPGTYHIVVAFDAEGNVEDFMSGTNWRLPGPIWDDGNDIFDWSREQLAHANEHGWAPTTFVKINDATGEPVTEAHKVPATVIDIVVSP